MKIILLFLMALALSSCVNKREDNPDKEAFKSYIDSLEAINLPAYLPFLKYDENKFEEALFRKFRTQWSDRPLGKIMLSDKKVIVLEEQVGSSLAPVLVLYDQAGHKLDSLYLYKNTDSGIDFEITDEAYIGKYYDIHVTTTIETWLLSPDSMRLEGSQRVIETSHVYQVDKNGNFFGFRAVNFQSPYPLPEQRTSHLDNFGKSAADFFNAKKKADALVKGRNTKEALRIMLPFALEMDGGTSEASQYCALLAQTMFRKEVIKEELSKGLESVR
jgi:hypothetical protein